MSPVKISNLSRFFLDRKFQKIFNRHMYLLLLIPLFLLAYHIAKPGISIAGDFPYLDTPDYAVNRLWLWVDKGSIDGFEFVSRFSIIGFWYLLSFFKVSSEFATKAMILLGFSLSSFSFYFSFLLFFKDRFTGSKTVLKISAILGSFFYAYNIWSFDRIHHWYLWIGYSTLPLFFISIFFSFKNPKDWKYIISSIFLWSFASTTPHMTLFYGIILIVVFLGFILNNLNKKKWKFTIHLGISFLIIVSSYFLVNTYWIYPYILASGTQILSPNYELTEDIVRLLSREGDFLNTFRILAYWLNTDVQFSPHSLLFPLWLCASFVVPLIAFSALFLRKLIKYTLIFSSIALVGILVAMGTYSPVDYYDIVLSTPTLSKFAWLLRDSDKLSFIITFAYSFLIGIVGCKVLSITSNEKNDGSRKLLIPGLFLFLLIVSIFISSYPIYKVRTEPLKPVILPAEFDRLNSFLSTINSDKVYFIPYPLYETQWKMNSRVGDIYQTISIKPSIESTEYNFGARNYYNYLEKLIIENRSNVIGNMIYPLGTSHLIFHNDTWNKIQESYDQNSIDFLKKLYYLEDLKNIANIGFYKIFKTNNDGSNDSVGEVNIPSQNIAVLSGLDIFASLNTLPSFNSLQSSLLFLNDILPKDDYTFMKNFDALILDRSSPDDEFAVSFVDDKHIIAPSDATFRNDPSTVWSKSRAKDPIHAEFHPAINSLGIENWDFDYGKGLVMTKAVGANITVPVKIENHNENNDNKDNNFYLFMRYLKNQKGGLIKIYLDDKLISKVDTLDRISNNFVWENVGSLNLTKGKHTLTLQNVVGFNAVNIFAIMPPDEMNRLRTETTHLLADKTRVIYLLEAESNFYNNKGKNSGSFQNLFVNLNNVTNADNNNQTSTITKTFKGQFKVPRNSDLVVLQFLVKNNSDSESAYSVKDLVISPALKKYNQFSSDFERKKSSVSLATLRQSDWLNYDKGLLSTSLETSRPIDGNTSLRADINQSDRPGWNVLSTDFIPIDDDAYYNATLDISAQDVKQLHSRILYFDLNQKAITGTTDYIFKGKDGTFKNTFTSGILPPRKAEYIKYQILTLSSNPKPSSYLLDNVKLEEIIGPNITSNFKLNYVDKGQNMLNVKNENYVKTLLKDNSTNYMIQTEPLPVKENHAYNYTLIAESKNVPSYSGIALFKSSSDVIENATRYGNNASNGHVLSMNNGSEIHTRLDIIKPSIYTIALRAKTCATCTFLKVSIKGDDSVYDKNVTSSALTTKVSLKGNDSALKWLYSNSTYPLKKGTYELRIYSDSQTDLDSVVIYPIDNDSSSGNVEKKHNEKLEELFSLQNNSSLPARISEYEKINPTKHIVHIKDATRPFMLAFAESYDPLWTAYTDSGSNNNNGVNNKNSFFKTNSIPLYGVTNGFYVNKTGDYNLVIEYEPQKWFVQGALISTISIVLISIGTYLFVKRKTMAKLLMIVIHRR